MQSKAGADRAWAYLLDLGLLRRRRKFRRHRFLRLPVVRPGQIRSEEGYYATLSDEQWNGPASARAPGQTCVLLPSLVWATSSLAVFAVTKTFVGHLKGFQNHIGFGGRRRSPQAVRCFKV